LKRFTVSGTGSRRKKRISLRAQLFITIFLIALLCMLVSAVVSNMLAHWRIEEFVEEHASELQPSGEPPFTVEPPPPFRPRPSYVNLSFIIAGSLGLVLALLLSTLLARRISRPLSDLASATRKIAAGDYTDRVNVDGGMEVEELEEAFNTLTESLARNEELRRNMVADAAHELRNPLATLRGNLELLQDGKINYDKDAIGSLLEDVILLSRLVEDLRQLSLAEAGQLELDMTAVNVEDSLKDLLSRFQREASANQISIEVEAAPDLPRVRADRFRIDQVLRNLVSNSIRHTPDGGRITIGAALSGDEVLFHVADTGPGISPGEIPYVFERFYRADKSRARTTGGAGLGLSIARSIVEMHGGHIWAESESGKGTEIYFTVPVYREEQNDTPLPG